MTTPQVTNVFSSKSDVAYHELRRMILSGELPAGSRLAQYVLAEQLRMSITPLREAIRRLSSEGLIELDNHKDARVSTISAPEARELFEVRLALDPAAVELAAERRTDDDIALMRTTVARLLPVTRKWGEDALTGAQRLPPRAVCGFTQRRADQDAGRPVGQIRPLPPPRLWNCPLARNPAPSTSTSTNRSSTSSSPKTPPAQAI